MIERQISTLQEHIVVHEDTGFFVINSGAFYAGELHQDWAQISFATVTPNEWKKSISTGVKHWEASLQKKKDDHEKKEQKLKVKEGTKQGGQKTKKRKLNNTGNGPVAGPSR